MGQRELSGKNMGVKDRKMCAMRGRMPLKQERSEYGKQIRKAYEGGVLKVPRANVQQFEIRNDGMSNTITTVQKDYLTIGRWQNMEHNKSLDGVIEVEKSILKEPVGSSVEDYLVKDYGVFKLSPRECLRLMAVKDTDIDKMASVNSNTQLYKQAGNSIVVTVLMAIFSQLNIKGVTPWNEMTEDERYDLVNTTRDYTPANFFNDDVQPSKQEDAGITETILNGANRE